MRVYAFIILATCFAALPARAANLPRHGVFLYSNWCFDRESGDAQGGFVKLTRTPRGNSLEYGWSAEGPMESVRVTNVHINSGKISFTVPPTPGGIYEGKSHHLEGTISTTELHLSGDGVPPLLPRQGLNYKPKVCAQP
jgi:hypothetical protein